MSRILTVDDDPRTRAITCDALRDFAPDAAFDGEIAITMMVERAYDLVVLDMQLATPDSWEVLQVLQDPWNGWPQVPIVAIGADTDPAVALRSWTLGAGVYLLRPFDPRDLRHVICRSLALPTHQDW